MKHREKEKPMNLQIDIAVLELDGEEAARIQKLFAEAAARAEDLNGRARVLVVDIFTDAVYFEHR